MLFLWKTHTGTAGFEPVTYAWLARLSGAVAIAPRPLLRIRSSRYKLYILYRGQKLYIVATDYKSWPLRGFVKLKNFQKSEKNLEVGGWVKPQLELFFFWGGGGIYWVFFVFLCCFHVKKKRKKWIFGVWPIRVFLGFLGVFNLTRPLIINPKSWVWITHRWYGL